MSGLCLSAIFFTIHPMVDRMGRVMKHLLIVLLVSVWSLLLPAQAGVAQLLQQEFAVSPARMSPRARALRFPALAALPADTDSFLALRELGQVADILAGADSASGIPLAGLGSGLESFAVGMSGRAVQDLQRLMPLFQVLAGSQSELPEQWLQKARPEAARAIVAGQREQHHRLGECLVEATRDFHLAPIYMVLTCKPESASLLQQLSVLPLMVPVEADGPLVLMARGSSRGFYLRGDAFDLSAAELPPEQEEQLARNLQQARLYVMAEVIGNKLVLVVCSHLDEVKLPSRAADSLLGTEKMAAFDGLMQRDALVLGHSSAAVVNMREVINLCAYTEGASFVQAVLERLGRDNAAMLPAVESVRYLQQQLAALNPQKQEAEQLMVWRDTHGLCLQLETDACGQSFEPGALVCESCADAPETVFYAEGTALRGIPRLDVPRVLQEVACVQQAYLATLEPQHARPDSGDVCAWQQALPAWQKAFSAAQQVAATLENGAALVLREVDGNVPGSVSLRAGTSDAAAMQAGLTQLREGIGALWEEGAAALEDLQLRQEKDALLLTSGNGQPLEASPEATPVPGGLVFSLNLPALARVLKRSSSDVAGEVEQLSARVEALQGSLSTQEDKLRLQLRVFLKKNP